MMDMQPVPQSWTVRSVKKDIPVAVKLSRLCCRPPPIMLSFSVSYSLLSWGHSLGPFDFFWEPPCLSIPVHMVLWEAYGQFLIRCGFRLQVRSYRPLSEVRQRMMGPKEIRGASTSGSPRAFVTARLGIRLSAAYVRASPGSSRN